ncbi:MAG TPA: DedA family protein [Candidatus Paceibacterota bacterium]|nr:DedA family protein [Candidatus Paceibacterota bacterium]
MISSILAFLAHIVIVCIQTTGYAGIFVLMALESANIPIPSEIIMPFSGFLAAEGNFSIWVVIIIGTLGNVFGSYVSYKLANWIVMNRHKLWILKITISDNFLDKSRQWFEKYGSVSVLFSRILPVVRTFISLPAGLGKMKMSKFITYTFLGSFIWSAALSYFGWYLGNNWQSLEKYFRRFDIAIVVVIAIIFIYWLWNHFGGKIRKNGEKDGK